MAGNSGHYLLGDTDAATVYGRDEVALLPQ
jgi:hypothetical protein